MVQKDLEIENAQNITEFGDKIRQLDTRISGAKQDYHDYRQSILESVTPAMKLFDTLFYAVLNLDLKSIIADDANNDEEIAEFNKEWKSTQQELNKKSKAWGNIYNVFYNAALHHELAGYPLFDDGRTLKKLVVQQFGNNSEECKLISAYTEWDNCRADVDYCYPAD